MSAETSSSMMKSDTSEGTTSVSARTSSKRKRCDDAAQAQPAAITSRRRVDHTAVPAPRPVSWADVLPADLVGTVATFLDEPHFVLNYAITAGPDLSRTIKKAYLKRNFRFYRIHLEKPGVTRAFLDANEDWTDFYDNPELLSSNERKIFNLLFTHILIVTMFGQVEVLMHLIERGLGINERTTFFGDNGVPLLFPAISSLNLPVLEFMIDHTGLDINATVDGSSHGIEGFTCLHFIATQDRDQADHAAIADVAALLLSHSKIDVNAVGRGGETPLHCAVLLADNEKHILPLLLSHEGIDVNFTDTRGLTPLHYAVRRWSREGAIEGNVKRLIEAGADLQVRNNNGQTPLELATDVQAVAMKEWSRKTSTRTIA